MKISHLQMIVWTLQWNENLTSQKKLQKKEKKEQKILVRLSFFHLTWRNKNIGLVMQGKNTCLCKQKLV